jgi:hypothetical protein
VPQRWQISSPDWASWAWQSSQISSEALRSLDPQAKQTGASSRSAKGVKIAFKRRKDLPSILRCDFRAGSPFGMWHHAQNSAIGTADAGDIVKRAVGIGLIGDSTIRTAIAKQHSILSFEGIEAVRVDKVITSLWAMGMSRIVPVGYRESRAG